LVFIVNFTTDHWIVTIALKKEYMEMILTLEIKRVSELFFHFLPGQPTNKTHVKVANHCEKGLRIRKVK